MYIWCCCLHFLTKLHCIMNPLAITCLSVTEETPVSVRLSIFFLINGQAPQGRCTICTCIFAKVWVLVFVGFLGRVWLTREMLLVKSQLHVIRLEVYLQYMELRQTNGPALQLTPPPDDNCQNMTYFAVDVSQLSDSCSLLQPNHDFVALSLPA